MSQTIHLMRINRKELRSPQRGP
jgi:hypothetical protein